MISHLAKYFAVSAIVFPALFCLSAAAQEQTERRYPWQYFWQQSLAAYKNKDAAAFLENSKKAVEAGPANHPTLFYNLARAYSLAGDKPQAIVWLEKTLAIGYGAEALTGGDFPFLRDAPEYAALRKKIAMVSKAFVKSKTAATVSERDLIPESIAYDSAEKAFYVGSLHKRKIVKIDRRGKTSDFVGEAADDLGAVVGIKIDGARGVLWAANNIAPSMKNFEKQREGVGMLHCYDLKTGKLVAKYELANQPRPHLLNDIAINKSGDLYITDSLSSVVHVLRRGAENLEVFAPLEPYTYPNGIALAKDESKLYVANLNGISVIDAKTGRSAPLAFPENVALAGADGLYFYENSLVAIQNFDQPNRVARFFLDNSGNRVARVEILEANHPLYKIPTTGTIDGKIFYYVANSQLRSFDENGKILPLDQLQNITILKLGL